MVGLVIFVKKKRKARVEFFYHFLQPILDSTDHPMCVLRSHGEDQKKYALVQSRWGEMKASQNGGF